MPGAAILSNPAKYVENEFKRIVDAANIRRMVFFNKNGAETSLTDLSNNKQNATLSLSASSIGAETAGKARTLNFNASTEYFEFADSDDLSFGDGSNDSAFSVVACLNINSLSSGIIVLGKDDETTGNTNKEWYIEIPSATKTIQFILLDNSINASIGRKSTDTFTSDIGSFVNVIGTYSGSKASSGIKIYKNATQVDTTNNNVLSYIAMENKNAKVGNYYTKSTGSKDEISNAKYAFVAIVAGELTQAQVTSIDALLRKYVGAI